VLPVYCNASSIL